MRYPRLKPAETNTFMHVYNRIAGHTGEYPFQDTEKEYFIRKLKRLNDYYVIDVIAYVCMSNHYHAIIYVPSEEPSNEEAAARYNRFHKGEKEISPEDPYCSVIASRLRDVSWFMKDLQEPFTKWFNRTRPKRRKGHLWGDRFKNTILESGLAVWDCWKYIEMNPVRAGIALDPAEYRFGSFGEWAAKGRHPFQDAVEKYVMPGLSGLLNRNTLDEIKVEMRKSFAWVTAIEKGRSPEEMRTAIAVAAEKEKFSTRVNRRVRYWVDGLVIGSELFVRDTIVTARVKYKLKKRRFVRAVNHKQQKQNLYCFKQLRRLIE